MQIQLVNRREGLPPEEIAGRLSTGWLCVSNVAVAGPALAVPGQPEPGKSVDVWMPPAFGAMMPQVAVVQALLMVASKGGDHVTLDDLAKLWFNQPLRDLAEKMQAAAEEEEVAE
jgi:hypothetical protein